MRKNIPLFTFAFAAYAATECRSEQQFVFANEIDEVCSDNVHFLFQIRRKMRSGSNVVLDRQILKSNNLLKIPVMVVESDPLVRLSIVEMVERENFEVMQAGDAAKALSILQRRPDIRVVLSEIMMPGSIDGMKLARIVRKRWPQIEIILTSGFRAVSTFDLPGKCVFVRKPFETHRLVAIFRGLAKSS